MYAYNVCMYVCMFAKRLHGELLLLTPTSYRVNYFIISITENATHTPENMIHLLSVKFYGLFLPFSAALPLSLCSRSQTASKNNKMLLFDMILAWDDIRGSAYSFGYTH